MSESENKSARRNESKSENEIKGEVESGDKMRLSLVRMRARANENKNKRVNLLLPVNQLYAMSLASHEPRGERCGEGDVGDDMMGQGVHVDVDRLAIGASGSWLGIISCKQMKS